MRLRRTAIVVLTAGSVALLPCAPALHGEARTVEGILPSGFGDEVDRDVERVRSATEPFKSLDRAAAAGYTRDVAHCVDNPPHGAMGYHHDNPSLMDAKLDVTRPEMLVYERLPGGEYRLNGVEYIVPLSAWSGDEPPRIMGQKLKRADSLGIWYLHVWVWQANPKGLFADWNPAVKCGGANR
jgi:hypothetical protein